MSKQTIYTFAKAVIRMNLRQGKRNAITRTNLKNLTGLDDRTNRNIIEDLRREGIPIISHSSDKGYWLPETISEVEHYIHEFRNRAKECNHMAGLAEQWLRDHANELEQL